MTLLTDLLNAIEEYSGYSNERKAKACALVCIEHMMAMADSSQFKQLIQLKNELKATEKTF